MILTVTLNPSIDISYSLTEFAIDDVNRATEVIKTAGGKGLNVSRVLKQLGEDVGATGFLGGSLGTFIRNKIRSTGIEDYFIDIKDSTRNCIAILHDNGKQTEVLESGPAISELEAEVFIEKFKTTVKEADVITISGSLPSGLPTEFYNQLLSLASESNVPVLFDSGGTLLEKALTHDHTPFLIKPNETEFADLLEITLNEEKDFIEALNNPLFKNVPWIVVTLGSKGAIVKNDDKIYRATIPEVDAVNPVGSGDSVIAGFAAGLSRKLTGKSLIAFGLAMGVLNAMEKQTGLIDVSKVDWCVEKIIVEEL